MTDERTSWDAVRRIADELELKLHLAGMDARDRWRALQPRLVDLEKQLASAGQRASKAVEGELSALGAAMRKLLDELAPGKKDQTERPM